MIQSIYLNLGAFLFILCIYKKYNFGVHVIKTTLPVQLMPLFRILVDLLN